MKWRKEGEDGRDGGVMSIHHINQSKGKGYKKIERKVMIIEDKRETSKLLCALSGPQLYLE